MSETKKSRGYLSATLNCRCPRCREGKLFSNRTTINFKKNMLMNKNCLVCGQPAEIEVGFYYGTGYVSYVLAIMITAISFAAWWMIIGFSTSDNRFFYWIGFNAVLLLALQPWLMRLSRSLWISFFVGYDRDWQKHQPADFSERINEEQANNW